MFEESEILKSRAEQYCDRNDLALGDRLGRGTQGAVWSAGSAIHESAIKIHSRRDSYVRERDAYVRLTEKSVVQVRGLTVPRLINSDDELFAIEMTIVSRPFIVDFGGAYLDRMPDHALDPRTQESWAADKAEQFDDRWLAVQTVLADFEVLYSLIIVDVNPGNIQF